MNGAELIRAVDFVHREKNIFLAADKSDIERIARYAVSGTRHHGQ